MWTKPSFLDLQNTKLCFPEAMRDRIPNAYATMSTNESFQQASKLITLLGITHRILKRLKTKDQIALANSQ